MENIKVSVIMATHKTNEEILEESINRILKHIEKNIEFIIVCDGDKEEYNRLKRIQDERVKVFLNEENRGLPYSLNLAIKNSTGEYIARMDSDDICIEDRIKKQVEYLENNKNVGVCGTNALLFGEKEGKKEIYLNNIEQIKVQLLYRATLVHPTVMIRRSVLNEFKYNEEYVCAQDFELWSRISEKINIAIVPIIGLKYRIHKKQASKEKEGIQKKLSMQVIKNNSKKITGKFDNKIYETLLILGGRKEFNKNNYKEVSDKIDYIIEKNKIFSNFKHKDMKKVLYNRFFELMIKNKILPLNTKTMLKCMKVYNFREIIGVIIK